MFDKLQGNGRIWVYVANRPLSPSEQSDISSNLNDFCHSWAAHGNQLLAEFHIVYNQLLVLAVDEDVEAASGCSIDKATASFKAIDTKYNLDLFNRMNLTFVVNDKIKIVQLADISQAYHAGLITDNTPFLDNTISLLSDFRNRWKVAFNQSWAYRKVKKSVQNA